MAWGVGGRSQKISIFFDQWSTVVRSSRWSSNLSFLRNTLRHLHQQSHQVLSECPLSVCRSSKC